MAAFRKKAGITNRAISKRATKIRHTVLMPPEVATYVAAFEAGVDLTRHLTPDEMRNVAEHHQMVQAARGGATALAPPKRGGAKAKATKPSTPAQFRFLPNVKVAAGAISESTQADALRMAQRVYPLLYVFENSVREFVDGHLTAEYGKDWWDDPLIVSRTVRAAYGRNKQREGKDRWVARKTARPIYYTELGHLGDIIASQKGWKVFEPIFNDQHWVRQHVKAFESPRNIVAHMNTVQEKNIKGLEVRAQEWFDQIRDHPVPD
jgi:Swt1-like HEPN